MKSQAMKKLSLFLIVSVICILAFSITPITSYAARSSVWNNEIACDFAGGNGTEADPYIIETAEQLAYLAQSVNKGYSYSGEYIKLTADIVLNDIYFEFEADTGLVFVVENWNTYCLGTGILGDTSGSDTTFDTVASTRGMWYDLDYSTENIRCPDDINVWTPIGNSSYSFEGNFDGNGHTVEGIYINTDSDYQGLFGYTYNATIKNVGIVNSYVNGDYYVGSVAGFVRADNGDTTVVDNCYNQGVVVGTYEIGGIIGRCTARINSSNTSSVAVRDCHNSGVVAASFGSAGGVVGKNEYNGVVEDCYNTGAVIGKDYIGGVVGFNDSFISDNGTPIVRNCYNTGTAKGDKSYNGYSEDIGGVVGRNENAVVENCYNTGDIVGYDSVGGVVGDSKNASVVSKSYNYGKVTGLQNSVGGVVGTASPYFSKGVITKCYNTGDVVLLGAFSDNIGDYSLYSDGFVGGIVGVAYVSNYSDALTIEECYNTGSVNGSIRVGGIFGGYPKADRATYGYNITIEKCYNRGAVNGKCYIGGIAGSFGESGSKLQNCYNAGAVSGTSDIGGIIGHKDFYGSPQNCYNVGSVTGSANVDAITISRYDVYKNVYYLDTCVSIKSTCGVELTKDQMKDASSFTSFDFDLVWEIGTACGYDYPTLNVFDYGHTEAIKESVDPTCTEPGFTTGKYCSVCNKVLVAQEVIPANGHSHVGIITDPTCVTNGYTTYTCYCGDSYVADGVSALGHSWIDADCDTPKTCTTCGETEGEVLGHSFKDATCDIPKTCEACGKTEGEKLGHGWIDADCDTPKTCTTCGETEGKALGHAWVDATTEAPKTCSRCGLTEGDKLPGDTPDGDETPDNGEDPDSGETPNDEEPAKKDHSQCKASFFEKLINAIINFFARLFGGKEKCVCGEFY